MQTTAGGRADARKPLPKSGTGFRPGGHAFGVEINSGFRSEVRAGCLLALQAVPAFRRRLLKDARRHAGGGTQREQHSDRDQGGAVGRQQHEVFNPDLGVEKALTLVAGLVRDAIESWYEQPEGFRVGFIGLNGSRAGII